MRGLSAENVESNREPATLIGLSSQSLSKDRWRNTSGAGYTPHFEPVMNVGRTPWR